MHLQFHAVTTLAPLGVLLLFFVAHMLAGVAVPYVQGYRPPLVRLAEKIAAWLELRLNRDMRDETQRTARGILVAYVLLVVGMGLGWALGAVMYRPYGWVAALVVLSLSVSVMGTLKTLRVVQKSLVKDDAKAAAAALAPFIDENLDRLDKSALARKAVEYAALGFNRYCVMPALFFAVFGAVGLFAVLAVLGMHGAFGADDASHRHFGTAARRLEQACGFVPARLTVLLMTLAALVVPKASPLRALRTTWNQAGFYGTKNEGCVVAGIAGALGVTLGGRAVRRSNAAVENKWVGAEGASAQVTQLDLQRGTLLVFVSYLWLIVLASCAFMVFS